MENSKITDSLLSLESAQRRLQYSGQCSLALRYGFRWQDFDNDTVLNCSVNARACNCIRDSCNEDASELTAGYECKF